jgi:hypothetical protein
VSLPQKPESNNFQKILKGRTRQELAATSHAKINVTYL